MDTRTGAFFPIIPFNFAASELHSSIVNEEAQSYVYEPASGIKIDTCTLLNVLWQGKKFDVITKWNFKAPPFVEGAIMSYYPSKEGEITTYFAQTVDPWNDGNDPPAPTSPWLNDPIGFAIGNVRFVEEPYPEDRNLARQQIREIYENPEVYGNINSSNTYQAERARLVASFDQIFDEWLETVQELLATISAKPDQETWGKYKTDLQRQVQVIPTIKTANKNVLLDQPLALFDFENSKNLNDRTFHPPSAAAAHIWFIKLWVEREADLEMFDLYNGFEKQFNFIDWQKKKRLGSKCLKFETSGGIESMILKMPTGFYYDTAEDKVFCAGVITGKPDFNFGWEYNYNESYTAFQNDTADEPAPILRFAKKQLRFRPEFFSDRYYNQISFDLDRIPEYVTNVQGSGTVIGGQYTFRGENPPLIGVLQYEVAYSTFFDNDALPINEAPAPDYNAEYPGYGPNFFVYSGQYFSGPDNSMARSFFSDFAQIARSYRESENGPVGKFKVVSANDDLIAEVDLYGPKEIYTEFSVTLKMTERWDGETE